MMVITSNGNKKGRIKDKFQWNFDGRIRAPPENELVEMIPTFQLGAKTDRRALQSKFKSWAKRMTYENGFLKLLNSGKIIIPKDVCDSLIMNLHSSKHINLESVINQIRNKYSWTKKNFGMDRDVVAECIAKNCTRSDCLKRMRMELVRINRSFCNSVTNSLSNQFTLEDYFKISSPLECIAARPFQWPLPFPVVPVLSSSTTQFQTTPFKGMGEKKRDLSKRGKTLGSSKSREESQSSKFQPDNPKIITQENEISFLGPISSPNESKENKCFFKFKRPTNSTEYKILMKAVNHNPNLFPKILGSKKTQFLSNLLIAPKSICSSRTLKRFQKELQNRKFLNRDCMIYRERKVLRDRNKMKNNYNERRAHLEMQKGTATIFTRKNRILTQDFSKKASQYLKFSRLGNNSKKIEDSLNKNGIGNEVCLTQRKEAVEIIDISSSDEEYKYISLGEKKTEEGMRDKLKHENPLHESNSRATIGKDEGSPNKPNSSGQQSEEHHLVFHEDLNMNKNSPLVSSMFYPIPSFNSYLSKNLAGANLYPSHFLLPQHEADNSINPPENTITHLQSPLTTESNAEHGIRHFGNYAFPPINPVSGPRQPIHTVEKPRSCFIVPNRNLVPRLIYPILIRKSGPNSNLLLMGKRQRRAVFENTQFLKSTNRDFRTGNLTTVTSTPSSSAAVTQLQQTKMKYEEKAQLQMSKRSLFKGDKKKVDIDEAMMRISNWIYRMKAALNPNMFQCVLEKSVKKLISQLDIGIYLVREARKSLLEIEELEDFQKFSAEILN